MKRSCAVPFVLQHILRIHVTNEDALEAIGNVYQKHAEADNKSLCEKGPADGVLRAPHWPGITFDLSSDDCRKILLATPNGKSSA